LHSRAVDESLEHFSNEARHEAYHLVFACSGILPNSPFLYMKNTDQDNNIVIEGIKVHTPADVVIDHVLNPTVGTVTGTEATPANCNAGTGNVADGDFYICMSGCVSGVINTGCAVVVDRTYTCSGCDEHNYNYEMDVIVPENKAMALFMMDSACSGCNIGGTIPFYYSRKSLHV